MFSFSGPLNYTLSFGRCFSCFGDFALFEGSMFCLDSILGSLNGTVGYFLFDTQGEFMITLLFRIELEGILIKNQ
jgi:hypothetical protein